MNSRSPLLTIITPAYNAEDFISETINSVLEARIPVEYEYLVINDGSKDGTGNILKSFDNRIRYFEHANIGESKTVNRGIELAAGKYILVINADDPLFSPDLIINGINLLESDEEIAAVYPDWRMIDTHGKQLKNVIVPEFSMELLLGMLRSLPGPGTLFRSDLAKEIGGRNPKWKYVSDYDFWLRLSTKGKIVHLPGILAQWRDHQNSASTAHRGKEMALERVNVIEDFLSDNEVSNSLASMALGNAYYMSARLAYFDSSIPGRRLLIRSFILRKRWVEQAKFHIVMYLLLLPLSRFIVSHIPNLDSRIREK